jgi:hypothetical protein
MGKYKVIITEVLEMELEVEADSLDEAVKKVDDAREEAGTIIKPLQTESMTARIFNDEESKELRWI